MSKCCRHPIAFDVHRCVGIYSMWTRECGACNQWLSLGESNDDDPRVAVEIRAAEIAADLMHRVGLGGHPPSSVDESHCWHWWDDYSPCCCCGDDPQLEEETLCEAGYLACCIAESGDA